jgi:uncharacterized protein YecT (DUF1311 family)
MSEILAIAAVTFIILFILVIGIWLTVKSWKYTDHFVSKRQRYVQSPVQLWFTKLGIAITPALALYFAVFLVFSYLMGNDKAVARKAANEIELMQPRLSEGKGGTATAGGNDGSIESGATFTDKSSSDLLNQPMESVDHSNKSSLGEAEIRPSFDCAKAGIKAEQLICQSVELSKLDIDLNQRYKEASLVASDPIKLKREQLTWMKDIRNRCEAEECIRAAYKARITQLQ